MKEIKILIIDDAYFFRNLVKKVLKEKPENDDIIFTVIAEAKNGTEGITKYFELKPDLVALDITMPDIDGVEVAKQIISKDPNAKILVISGNTNDEIKEAILKAGALDYLQKPFQPAFLWNKLDNLYKKGHESVKIDTVINSEHDDDTDKIILTDESKNGNEEDWFNNQEIEIENHPNQFKSQEVIISNENDIIEFPENYQQSSEQNDLSTELNKYEETPEDFLFEVTPIEPQTISNKKNILEKEENIYNNNTNFDYNRQNGFKNKIEHDYQNEKPIDSETSNDYVMANQNNEEDYNFTPIAIKPPRSKILNNDFNEDLETENDYDHLADRKSQEGLFSKIKKIFKK